ncbi:MAG: hypothetical protein MJZ41_06715 [Bacteroidaceae bacterium]|nr:hypothetical protein [Bacteroidaceae bacterium]
MKISHDFFCALIIFSFMLLLIWKLKKFKGIKEVKGVKDVTIAVGIELKVYLLTLNS